MMFTVRTAEYQVNMYLSPARSHTLQISGKGVFGTWEEIGQIITFHGTRGVQTAFANFHSFGREKESGAQLISL